MELVYQGGEITSVIIHYAPLQKKLTNQEKMAFFACEAPDQTVWQNITWLEADARNVDDTPKTTMALTVASMVTAGLITQARADEILA